MINFPISESKVSDLLRRMDALSLREEDLEEGYYRPSGKGCNGKSLTGVTLLHKTSGIRVRCNRESSQGINRFLARRTLVEELEARRQNKTRHEVKAEKIRQEKVRRKGSRKRTQPLPNPFGMSPGELAFVHAEEQARAKAAAHQERAAAANSGSSRSGRGGSGGGDGSAGLAGSPSRRGFDLAQAERAFILRMPANGLPTMF